MATSSKPIWEQIADIGAALPDDAIAVLPVDGASQLDHYLYGAPKKMATTIKSKAEELLLAALRADGIEPVVGHMFHGEREWRFDFAYPPLLLAIEVDGRGRHQREKGEREDMQKQNAAIELGWRVLRYPASSVTTHKRRALIVEQIKRIVCGVQCEDSAACVLVGD